MPSAKELLSTPCLGPFLWLLIANFILKEQKKLRNLLYAFADGFSIIFSGLWHLEIGNSLFPRYLQPSPGIITPTVVVYHKIKP